MLIAGGTASSGLASTGFAAALRFRVALAFTAASLRFFAAMFAFFVAAALTPASLRFLAMAFAFFVATALFAAARRFFVAAAFFAAALRSEAFFILAEVYQNEICLAVQPTDFGTLDGAWCSCPIPDGRKRRTARPMANGGHPGRVPGDPSVLRLRWVLRRLSSGGDRREMSDSYAKTVRHSDRLGDCVDLGDEQGGTIRLKAV